MRNSYVLGEGAAFFFATWTLANSQNTFTDLFGNEISLPLTPTTVASKYLDILAPNVTPTEEEVGQIRKTFNNALRKTKAFSELNKIEEVVDGSGGRCKYSFQLTEDGAEAAKQFGAAISFLVVGKYDAYNSFIENETEYTKRKPVNKPNPNRTVFKIGNEPIETDPNQLDLIDEIKKDGFIVEEGNLTVDVEKVLADPIYIKKEAGWDNLDWIKDGLKFINRTGVPTGADTPRQLVKRLCQIGCALSHGLLEDRLVRYEYTTEERSVLDFSINRLARGNELTPQVRSYEAKRRFLFGYSTPQRNYIGALLKALENGYNKYLQPSPEIKATPVMNPTTTIHVPTKTVNPAERKVVKVTILTRFIGFFRRIFKSLFA